MKSPVLSTERSIACNGQAGRALLPYNVHGKRPSGHYESSRREQQAAACPCTDIRDQGWALAPSGLQAWPCASKATLPTKLACPRRVKAQHNAAMPLLDARGSASFQSLHDNLRSQGPCACAARARAHAQPA